MPKLNTKQKYLEWLDILQKKYKIDGSVNNQWLKDHLGCSRQMREYILKNYDIDLSPYISGSYTYRLKDVEITNKILSEFNPSISYHQMAKNLKIPYAKLLKIARQNNLVLNKSIKYDNTIKKAKTEEQFKKLASIYSKDKTKAKMCKEADMCMMTLYKYLRLMDLK